MKRNFIATLLLAVCCLLTFSSFAQNYTRRPIRMTR